MISRFENRLLRKRMLAVASCYAACAFFMPSMALADCDDLRKVASIIMKHRQQTNDIQKTMDFAKAGLGCKNGDAACNGVEELTEQAFRVRRYITTKDRLRAVEAFAQSYYDGCIAR